MRFGILLTMATLAAALVRGQSDDKKNPKAQQGVLKLADALEKSQKSEAIAAQAKAVLGDVQGLDEIMVLFRPRGRGGVGFGPAKGLDGIEYFLTQHAFETPRKLITDALEKRTDDLVQLGLRAAAIAEVLGQYDAKKRFGDAKIETWNKSVAALKAPGLELVQHARAKKAAEMLTALQKIHAACTSCHYHFRQ
jgi:hypothetical protein